MPIVDPKAAGELLAILRRLYAAERRARTRDPEHLEAITRAAQELGQAAAAAEPVEHGTPEAEPARRRLSTALARVLGLLELHDAGYAALLAACERVQMPAPRPPPSDGESWAAKRKGGG